MEFTALLLLISTSNVLAKLSYPVDNRHYNALADHTLVTESNVFPYVVAVLKKFSYLSAGALLDDRWVLTAADSLFLVRESTRIIKVRLGSINYKKGGVLLPVKAIEVHPQFDDSRPMFDVALVMLAERVWLTPTLNPIRLQPRLREVTASHFIVTAWTPFLKVNPGNAGQLPSMDSIKQRRILSVSHLHPTYTEICADELASLDINYTQSVMCLDPDVKSDPCWRDSGAPVVLNGVLWGIISSWRPDDCYSRRSASFATLVAAHAVSAWISATTRPRAARNDSIADDGTVFEEESNDI